MDKQGCCTSTRQSRLSSRILALVIKSCAIVLVMSAWAPSTRADVLDVCPSGCPFSLVQAAVLAASNGDTVRLFYDGTLIEPNILIDRDITIEGFGGIDTQLRGADTAANAPGRVFWIAEGATVTLRNFNLRAGKDSPGGCIRNDGSLTVESVYIGFCGSDGNGGGIYNSSMATMHLDDVSMSENWSNGNGGHIYNEGVMVVTSSILSTSYADLGGAIYNEGNLTLDGARIDGGAAQEGGAIYIADGASLNADNSRFRNNRASQNDDQVAQGGALMVYGDADIRNSSWRNNYARSNGGNARGGAISIAPFGEVSLSNSTLAENGEAAQDLGGAIQVGGAGSLELANVTITKNTAKQGGGINVFKGVACAPFCLSGSAEIANSIIHGNNAVDNGYTDDCSGNLLSLGYNLVGVAGVPATLLAQCVLPGETDGLQFGVNPLLDTSFPSVSTPDIAPLQAGSPAINAGNPTGCFDPQNQLLDTDQRGAPRVGICDLGAYEYGSILPMFSDSFESLGQ